MVFEYTGGQWSRGELAAASPESLPSELRRIEIERLETEERRYGESMNPEHKQRLETLKSLESTGHEPEEPAGMLPREFSHAEAKAEAEAELPEKRAIVRTGVMLGHDPAYPEEVTIRRLQPTGMLGAPGTGGETITISTEPVEVTTAGMATSMVFRAEKPFAEKAGAWFAEKVVIPKQRLETQIRAKGYRAGEWVAETFPETAEWVTKEKKDVGFFPKISPIQVRFERLVSEEETKALTKMVYDPVPRDMTTKEQVLRTLAVPAYAYAKTEEMAIHIATKPYVLVTAPLSMALHPVQTATELRARYVKEPYLALIEFGALPKIAGVAEATYGTVFRETLGKPFRRTIAWTEERITKKRIPAEEVFAKTTMFREAGIKTAKGKRFTKFPAAAKVEDIMAGFKAAEIPKTKIIPERISLVSKEYAPIEYKTKVMVKGKAEEIAIIETPKVTYFEEAKAPVFELFERPKKTRYPESALAFTMMREFGQLVPEERIPGIHVTPGVFDLREVAAISKHMKAEGLTGDIGLYISPPAKGMEWFGRKGMIPAEKFLAGKLGEAEGISLIPFRDVIPKKPGVIVTFGKGVERYPESIIKAKEFEKAYKYSLKLGKEKPGVALITKRTEMGIRGIKTDLPTTREYEAIRTVGVKYKRLDFGKVGTKTLVGFYPMKFYKAVEKPSDLGVGTALSIKEMRKRVEYAKALPEEKLFEEFGVDVKAYKGMPISIPYELGVEYKPGKKPARAEVYKLPSVSYSLAVPEIYGKIKPSRYEVFGKMPSYMPAPGMGKEFYPPPPIKEDYIKIPKGDDYIKYTRGTDIVEIPIIKPEDDFIKTDFKFETILTALPKRMGYEDVGRGLGLDIGRLFKYTPTVMAQQLDIRGAIPEFITGLEVRPLVSKRRRKKK